MHDADDARMTIHVGMKKSLDGLIGRRHGRREGYDRFIGAAHVMGGARGLCTQPAVALRNYVFDHPGNEPTTQLVNESRAIGLAMADAGLGEELANEREVCEVSDCKKLGAQSVVDIVGVVGDIIGNGGDLGLGAGERRKLEVLISAVELDCVRNPPLAVTGGGDSRPEGSAAHCA